MILVLKTTKMLQAISFITYSLRQLDDLNLHSSTWNFIYKQYFKNDDILNYDLDYMLQNMEDEEDFEEIDQEVDQPYDWMNVAAGPNNIQQEVDLGRR